VALGSLGLVGGGGLRWGWLGVGGQVVAVLGVGVWWGARGEIGRVRWLRFVGRFVLVVVRLWVWLWRVGLRVVVSRGDAWVRERLGYAVEVRVCGARVGFFVRSVIGLCSPRDELDWSSSAMGGLCRGCTGGGRAFGWVLVWGVLGWCGGAWGGGVGLVGVCNGVLVRTTQTFWLVADVVLRFRCFFRCCVGCEGV